MDVEVQDLVTDESDSESKIGESKMSFLWLEYGDNKLVRFLSSIHGSAGALFGKVKEKWEKENRRTRNQTRKTKN